MVVCLGSDCSHISERNFAKGRESDEFGLVGNVAFEEKRSLALSVTHGLPDRSLSNFNQVRFVSCVYTTSLAELHN